MNTRRHEKDFAIALKALRAALCLTQEGLAQEMGIAKATIQSWEASNSLPTARSWKTITEKYQDVEEFTKLKEAYTSTKSRLSRA